MLRKTTRTIEEVTSQERDRPQLALERSTIPPPDTPYTRLAFQAFQEISSPDINRSILVVSAGARELTSSVSLSLAVALGGMLAQNTILVDAAGGSGSLGEVLGWSDSRGLHECVDADDMKEALRPTSLPTVRFLPAGAWPAASARFPAVASLLDLAGAERTLVISGASLLSNPVAMMLAPHAGITFVVAREMVTRVSEIRQTEQVLAAAGVRRVGMLVVDPR